LLLGTKRDGAGSDRINGWSKRSRRDETAGVNPEQESVTVDAVTETRRCVKGGRTMKPTTILLVFGCGMGFVLALLFLMYLGGTS